MKLLSFLIIFILLAPTSFSFEEGEGEFGLDASRIQLYEELGFQILNRLEDQTRSYLPVSEAHEMICKKRSGNMFIAETMRVITNPDPDEAYFEVKKLFPGRVAISGFKAPEDKAKDEEYRKRSIRNFLLKIVERPLSCLRYRRLLNLTEAQIWIVDHILEQRLTSDLARTVAVKKQTVKQERKVIEQPVIDTTNLYSTEIKIDSGSTPKAPTTTK